jgi:hypothetical protein
MSLSIRKYVDPSDVLNGLVDDYGNRIGVGDQKDVGEFNMILLARIEEGLQTGKPLQALNPENRLDRSDSISGSLSEAQMAEEGIVTQLFYGKHVGVISFNEEDGTPIQQEKKEVFGQVILNVEENDLYSAWDASYANQIGEYTTESGYKTKAFQEIWLDKLPNMMLFHIDRVKFQHNKLVKINNSFSFPDVIYPDRFMEKNRERYGVLRHDSREYKRRIHLLEESAKKFYNYQDQNISLEQVLALTQSFLHQQSTSEPMELEQTDQITLYDPNCLGALDKSQSGGLIQATGIITQYLNKLREGLHHLNSQSETLKIQKEAIFDIPDLKQNPYRLHSILIHEGIAADSGHYYAYIFDWAKQVWRKYNDIHVTEVSAEEVLSKSIGGQGITSAYCLVYISEAIIPKESVLCSYKLNPDEGSELYVQCIPPEVKQYVLEENRKETEEVLSCRAAAWVKQIRDLYELRLTQALPLKDNHKDVTARRSIESYKHELVNLPVYLMVFTADENLAKWVILDQCVREVDPLHRDLTTICADENDPLHMKLKKQFMTVCREVPKSLVLDYTAVNKLKNETTEFESKYRDANITAYILKNINQEHFLESFYGISYMLNQPRPEISLYQKIPRDLNKVLALRICSKINECLYKNDLETALQEGKLLSMLTILYIENSDVHFKQIIANLNYSINWAVSKGVSTPDFEKEMRDLIQVINTGDLIPVIDLEALPEELNTIIHKLDSFEYTAWFEGWKDGTVAKEFMNEYTKLKNGPVTPWLNMHTKLTNSRMMIQEAERLSYERQANIIPPA